MSFTADDSTMVDDGTAGACTAVLTAICKPSAYYDVVMTDDGRR